MSNKKSNLEKILIYDEGLKTTPYLDSEGYWTIGVGHFIGNSLEKLKLSESVVLQLLSEDIGKAIIGVANIFGKDTINSWDQVRYEVIISLVFNMGEGSFKEFKETIKAIKEKRWEDAAKHLKDSLWARQVDPKQVPDKGRDDRLAFMLKTGKYDSEYACENSEV